VLQGARRHHILTIALPHPDEPPTSRKLYGDLMHAMMWERYYRWRRILWSTSPSAAGNRVVQRYAALEQVATQEVDRLIGELLE
jgi:hypothetical protein